MTDQELSGRRKKWYWVGAGIVVAGFLGAIGPWAFNLLVTAVQSRIDVPFNANLAQPSDSCERFVVDESLVHEIPLDANGEIDEAWLSDNRALQAAPRPVTLSLVGDEGKTVLINSVRLVEVEAVPMPESPVIVGECVPAGGELPENTMTPEFESGTITMLDPDGVALSTLTIGSGGSPEVFGIVSPDISADNPMCYCTWRIGLDWTGSGGDGTVTVDLDGEPLAFVSTEPDWKNYWFDDGVLFTYDEDGAMTRAH